MRDVLRAVISLQLIVRPGVRGPEVETLVAVGVSRVDAEGYADETAHVRIGPWRRLPGQLDPYYPVSEVGALDEHKGPSLGVIVGARHLQALETIELDDLGFHVDQTQAFDGAQGVLHYLGSQPRNQ